MVTISTDSNEGERGEQRVSYSEGETVVQAHHT